MECFKRFRPIIKVGCGLVIGCYSLFLGVSLYVWSPQLREGTVSPSYVVAFPAETAWNVANFLKDQFIVERMIPFDPEWIPTHTTADTPKQMVSDSMSARWPGTAECPIDAWTRLPPGMAVPSPSTLAGKVVVIYCFQHW